MQNIVEDREVMALVYLCDDLTIRAGSGGRQHKSGHRAQWTDGGDPDVTMDEDYQVWEKVSAEVKGKDLRGIYPPGLSGMLG